jgi:adenosine 3'-phospho 5'-phosphosulfate transporter B3
MIVCVVVAQVVPNIVIFSLLGYLSVIFVLLTIKRFGATNAEIVKSLRKVLTIVISFVFIAKPFRPMHLVGGMLFLGSIMISVRVKAQRKRASSRGIPDESSAKLLPSDTSPMTVTKVVAV